tara:strand:+ start:808 stop:1341 length:534 start_codon:yes stop_codon:yes gene_type:complete
LELTWGKSVKLNYDLDSVLVWARKCQLATKGEVVPDSLGVNQMCWEESAPDDFFTYLNNVFPLLDQFSQRHIRKGPRYCNIWEYQPGSELVPHIDDRMEIYSTNLIVPIIGRFTTNIIEPDNHNNVIDSITYGPGECFLLNASKHWHKGKPVDEYRLAVMFYIKKEFDLDSYFDEVV